MTSLQFGEIAAVEGSLAGSRKQKAELMNKAVLISRTMQDIELSWARNIDHEISAPKSYAAGATWVGSLAM
jgi:hypothetical protein